MYLFYFCLHTWGNLFVLQATGYSEREIPDYANLTDIYSNVTVI